MKLIIVRHGESEGNEQGILQGRLDGRLSAKGRSQILKVGERLRSEKPAAIYSSDLSRAKDTAQAIARYHPAAPFFLEECLRERSWGQFEGGPSAKWTAHLEQSGLPYHEYVPPGGEGVRDVYARVAPFAGKIKEKHASDTVIVVAHHSVNRALIYYLIGHPLENWRAIDQLNTCVNVLEVSSEGPASTVLINCVAHLENA